MACARFRALFPPAEYVPLREAKMLSVSTTTARMATMARAPSVTNVATVSTVLVDVPSLVPRSAWNPTPRRTKTRRTSESWISTEFNKRSKNGP